MRRERGFTLVELLVVLAIVSVLLGMAIAGYHYARIRGGESTAVATLDTINKAQFAYLQTCGNQRYSPSLVDLGTPVPGSGSPFLSPDLAQPDPLSKGGYTFHMSGTALSEAPPTCTQATPLSGYQISADPIIPNVTGTRYFGTNGDRVIFEDLASFTGNMPESGAPGHGHEIK